MKLIVYLNTQYHLVKMNAYDHKKIEKKWQSEWAKKKIFVAKEKSQKKKCYVLDMFPYPSGEGLHVGHPKGYIATDIFSRMKRMQGFSVLHPMGFDAFGLPAENYAIKTKTNPAVGVARNVKRYKEQLAIFGFDYDWGREINTTDPEYYKWTQWIFLQMWKKGLAFESYEPINWCPSCKTGLANEDVENDGTCERCGTKVEKKPMRQWVLRITDYAEKLLSGLDEKDAEGNLYVQWPESIKELQRNWVGKSEGALVKFKIKDSEDFIEVFTTRIDTIFSGTFLILAPEHPLLEKYAPIISNKKEIIAYQKKTAEITEIDRTNATREKSGVLINGLIVINPATGKEMPVWIADFVLAQYGTGAVFADAHDRRDFDMAKKYNIPLAVSIRPATGGNVESVKSLTECFEGDGILFNSGEFDGLSSETARGKITAWLDSKGLATPKIQYKLKDWVYSRQRYWGEPIPLIHCEKCGVVAVPEKELPVKLPKVKKYEPTGTGESPLSAIDSWVNVKCPKCKGKAKRETNTMPQWAGSSWYHLRYTDPKNTKKFADPKKEKYWMPVDLYVGGAEHATRHLIYARFWHRFLFDCGYVGTPEPYKKYQYVGLIMAEDGRKMSKRWQNVVNPYEIIALYGADSMRLYEMFMGPFDQAISWNTNSMIGSRRFIERVWKLCQTMHEKDIHIKSTGTVLPSYFHRTIKKVGEDIESLKYNTAVSTLMMCLNEMESDSEVGKKQCELFLQILAPFAPHVTEELWRLFGNKKSIHVSDWPLFDPNRISESRLNIPVQINGKVRATIIADATAGEEKIKELALEDPDVAKWLVGKKVIKVIYVKGRLLSLVLA